jgi:hypothetical protein
MEINIMRILLAIYGLVKMAILNGLHNLVLQNVKDVEVILQNANTVMIIIILIIVEDLLFVEVKNFNNLYIFITGCLDNGNINNDWLRCDGSTYMACDNG